MSRYYRCCDSSYGVLRGNSSGTMSVNGTMFGSHCQRPEASLFLPYLLSNLNRRLR